MDFQPYGLSGGEPGRATANSLTRDGQTAALASKVTMSLERDALVVHDQAGGGGFGDPLERDPDLVGRDVWNGKVSAAFARSRHGVVVAEATGVVDAAATGELRRRLRFDSMAAE
jgi:N-methylhydantoinase B